MNLKETLLHLFQLEEYAKSLGCSQTQLILARDVS